MANCASWMIGSEVIRSKVSNHLQEEFHLRIVMPEIIADLECRAHSMPELKTLIAKSHSVLSIMPNLAR
jgi:hypothetical protein